MACCVLVCFVLYCEIKYSVSDMFLPEGNFRSQYMVFKKDVAGVFNFYKDRFLGNASSLKESESVKPQSIKHSISELFKKDDNAKKDDKDAKYDDIGFTGYYLKADALALEGKYKESLEFYNKAIAINSSSEKCIYNRATVYLNLKMYENAIIDYTFLIEKNTKELDVYFNRAMAFYYLEQYDKALADCDYVIKQDPSRYVASFMRGNIYVAKGMYTAAVSDYTKAANLAPKDAGIFYNRGIAYEYIGKDNMAISDYNKALELDSKHQKASTSLDRLYKKNGFADRIQKEILEPRNLA